MNTLRVALLAGTALAAAPSAFAADLGGPSMKDGPYIAQTPFSWSGFYLGTHVGYGWSTVDWQGLSDNLEGSGWLAGGQVGYNWQRGALVFGLEADASYNWVDGSLGGDAHSIDWQASIRARLGLAVNNSRTLLYTTGGVAWADVNYASAGNFSETHFGWVYGGGIEHMLSQNLSARVEYLYYDFNDATAPGGVLGAGPTSVDPSMHVVRFGLNLKF